MATAEVALFVIVQFQFKIFSLEMSPIVPSVVMLPLRVCPLWKPELSTNV